MYSILYYSKHLYNAQINSELFKWVGWKKKMQVVKIQEEFRVKKLAKAVSITVLLFVTLSVPLYCSYIRASFANRKKCRRYGKVHERPADHLCSQRRAM